MTTREALRTDGRGVVEQLAAWVLAARAHDLSQAAVRQAQLLLLDTIGCGFAALNEQSARALLGVVEASGGAPQCTVIGQTRRTSAPNAVLANGALVRILDFNDYVNARSGDLGGHPSDNIPVALAAGELSGASGREVIAAVVLGYEIFGRCKELMEPHSAWDGGTVSGLAGPSMAGRLMGLDRGRLAHAIALSAARAATSTAVRFGDISAAKSIANALVAQAGVQAALLAEQGVTGPLAILDDARGLAPLFAGGPKEALGSALDGSAILRAHVKIYPCVNTAQSAVAAAIRLNAAIKDDVERIARIEVTMPDYRVIRRHQDDEGRKDPKTREAADHSFPFLIAVALIDGRLGPAQFDNERWNDPQVRSLMARIALKRDASLNLGADAGYPCAMRIALDPPRPGPREARPERKLQRGTQ